MKNKIIKNTLIITILTIIVTTISSLFIISNNNNKMIKENLSQHMDNLVINYENDINYFDNNIFNTPYRITLIDENGLVLYDNKVHDEILENHNNRPEIISAYKHGRSSIKRYSNSINEDTYYLAQITSNNMILRLSISENTFMDSNKTSITIMLFIAIIITIIATILANILSKKLIDPIVSIDLNHPLKNNTFNELSPLLQKIDDNNKMRSEFSANVSHELKSPLTVILGYAEIMAKSDIDQKRNIKFSNIIYKKTNQLITMIDNIMQISQLDETTSEINMEQINYSKIINMVVSELDYKIVRSHISVKIRCHNVIGIGNETLIHELLYNLVDNSIKYNKTNGSIVINIKVIDKMVNIVIKDTGIGISDDQIARIFERFYRIDKSHNQVIKGSGLGLSLVKHIVILHGGTINVESELNKFTKFTIDIPVENQVNIFK